MREREREREVVKGPRKRKMGETRLERLREVEDEVRVIKLINK